MTNYIAQRLIEREQVLAADIRTLPRDEERRVALYAPAATAAPVPERCRRRFLVRLLVFLIDLLGVAMLFAVTCLQAAGSRLRLRASS